MIETALAELAAHDTQHLHPKEPEARVMKGRLEARLQLDYNAQVVTDGEFVVAEDVSADETDYGQLSPMLAQWAWCWVGAQRRRRRWTRRPSVGP